jgi:hypothetical protein
MNKNYIDPKGYWGDPSGNVRRTGNEGGEQEIIAIATQACSDAEWNALYDGMNPRRKLKTKRSYKKLVFRLVLAAAVIAIPPYHGWFVYAMDVIAIIGIALAFTEFSLDCETCPEK